MTLQTLGAPSGGDDTATIQAAFDAIDDGGQVDFDPGATYLCDSSVTIKRTALTDTVTINGRGATIKRSGVGAGAVVIFDGAGSHGSQRGPTIENLHVDGAGVATTGYHLTDCGQIYLRRCVVNDIDGPAFWFRNWAAFSENTSLIDCRARLCDHAVKFSGAADTGGPEPQQGSFARHHCRNFTAGSISVSWFLIETNAAVYDSLFDHIKGNMMSSAPGDQYIFDWRAGSGGATEIRNVCVEQGDGNRYLFAMSNSGNGPIVGPHISLRSSIQMMTSTSNISHFGRHRWLSQSSQVGILRAAGSEPKDYS